MNFSKKSFLWHIAKKIDMNIIKSLRKYINRYILFSPYMAEKLKIDEKSYIVVEGMVDSKVNTIKKEKSNIIMYAGGINEDYGVYDLIESFEKSHIDNYELHLYGSCNDLNRLKKLTSKYNNVKYFGTIPRSEIVHLESNAMFLVNPRRSNKEFAKYSFPSKTMEYLMSGTPVIMYKLDSIPQEYDKYIFYIDDSYSDGLTKKLEEVCSMKYFDIKKVGIDAQNFVVKNKNNVIQCKRIIDWVVNNNE